MSLNKPTRCKNCNEENVIWWEESWRPGIKRPRPYDIHKYHQYPGQPDKWWHECNKDTAKEYPLNTDYRTKPLLHPCVFPPCEFELIFNPQKGYHCEGGMDGDRHWCLHMPKNYEFDPDNPGQKRLKPALWHQAQEYNRKLEELRSKKSQPLPNTNVPHEDLRTKTFDVTQNKLTEHIPTNKPPARQLEDLVKEQNLILQGIAAQLQKMLDTLEVSTRYQKASKDILQEYKDEVIDTIKNPHITFESGREEVTIGDNNDDVDLYDEIADTDDHSYEDLGGFKPSDTGNKGVRNDLV